LLELLLAEEVGLVLAEMVPAQLIRRLTEIGRELFDGLKVIMYSDLSEVTTLEFLQQHFSKMGHRSYL